ncbi:MAG: hypothetical protein A2Z31_00245 [candidate division NC10 bacterium RBG_16_65_8]|nr:MAG: hypothetical protein A2Z31_00245 [candidate division NC10 bacterium RBG_16_65_8]
MSQRNGHLPAGAIILTLDLLEEATTSYVALPEVSRKLGQDVRVKVRAIRKVDYFAMVPAGPPGSEIWGREMPPEERIQRTRDWLDTLSPTDRAERQRQIAAVTYQVLAIGLVEPAVTAETARRFADDADIIALEILRLSGLVPDEVVEAPTEAVPAPA